MGEITPAAKIDTLVARRAKHTVPNVGPANQPIRALIAVDRAPPDRVAELVEPVRVFLN